MGVPPVPDSERFTQDAPTGVTLRVTCWDDFKDVPGHGELATKDITFLVHSQIEQAQKSQTNYSQSTDPFVHMHHVFKRLLDIGYLAQVTGSNLDTLYWSVHEQVHQALTNVPLADTDGVFGYSLSVSHAENPEDSSGDFFAQLASQVENPGSAGPVFVRDDGGDVLLLKYVTHGNQVKFDLTLNFGGQVGAQLDDPFSVITGPPSFTIKFDIVTRIALRLPHRSADGIKVLSETFQTAAADVHAQNAEAWLIKAVSSSLVRFFGGTGTLVPVQRALDSHRPTDISGSIQKSLDQISQRLTSLLPFDQAEYQIDWSEADGLNATVVMRFIANPWRQIDVSIDRIQENFVVDPNAGTVATSAKVRIGDNGSLNDYEGFPEIRIFRDGTRFTTIHVDIWRRALPRIIAGHLKEENGSWKVYYDDGSSQDLGVDFDPRQVPPMGPTKSVDSPVPSGLARTFNLRVDYAMRTIAGTVDGMPIAGTEGQSIRIPGSRDWRGGIRQLGGLPGEWIAGDWRGHTQEAHTAGNPPRPDVWLTVAMRGTRTPKELTALPDADGVPTGVW